jgi:hypothetical protein
VPMPKRGAMTRRLTVCIAVLALLLITTGSGLWHHHDSASSTPCQVCHVGHLPTLPAATAVPVPRPVLIARSVPFELLTVYVESVAQYGPPRAPPA